MSWWAIPIIGGLSVLGLLAGWTVGAFLISMRDEPHDVWEDWEN